MFSRVMLIIYYAYKSPGEYGYMQILIQQTWGGTWDFAFHISSQEMLFFLVYGSHLHDKTWGIIFGPLLRRHNLPKQLIHWHEFKYILYVPDLLFFIPVSTLLIFELFNYILKTKLIIVTLKCNVPASCPFTFMILSFLTWLRWSYYTHFTDIALKVR